MPQTDLADVHVHEATRVPNTVEAAAALLADLTGQRRRTQRRTGAVMAVAGLMIVLVALWGIRDWSAAWRTVVGVAGGTVGWMGVQRLGRLRYGRSFQLGLFLALAWVLLVVLLAVFADLLPLEGIDAPLKARNARPALVLGEPLGTDNFGRSMLSRTIYGARVSLLIGFVAATAGMIVGGVLGMLAGFFRGWVDGGVNIMANSMLAFPPIVLLLAMVSVLEPSVQNLSLGLAVLTIPTFARLSRATTLAYAQREFVVAARAMGARPSRILRREILPNVLLPLASYAFLVVAVLIVAEGSLSFIGLGLRAPRPSWGGMIAQGQQQLKSDPHLVFVPAAVMFLTVLSINRVGEWVRQKVFGDRAPM